VRLCILAVKMSRLGNVQEEKGLASGGQDGVADDLAALHRLWTPNEHAAALVRPELRLLDTCGGSS
jgi:hypothetical protein